MGAVVEWIAVVRTEDLPIVVRTEVVLPAAMATDIHPHRTDNRRDRHTRHHNKALAGMSGMEGRRCKTIVDLGVGLRVLRGVGPTAGVPEADMDPLATLSRTDGEGMAVAVVVAMVVQGPLQGVMVVTVPQMGTVAVHTAVVVIAGVVVAHTMELQEVGGVVVGNSVIYILYIFTDARGQRFEFVHRVQISCYHSLYT